MHFYGHVPLIEILISQQPGINSGGKNRVNDSALELIKEGILT